MASSSSSTNESNHQNNISKFIHSTSSALHSILNQWTQIDRPTHYDSPRSDPQSLNPKLTSSSICVPLPFSSSSFHNFDSDSDNNNNSINSSSPPPPTSSSTERLNSNPNSNSNSGLPSTVRISRIVNEKGGGGGPAFVGQVFSMCDVSGTGLMAVSTHIQIPFLSKRTPEWLKKMFAAITKNDRDGPMFRFFMDIGDAVSYVKQLNVPSGVVGACRLDLAYEHFKEKPHMFQFVPNVKQVKEAKKLLMKNPHNNGMKTIDGVPVFTAENLDIAIATNDGIKWYTPYFFDKKTLDNILEDSIDQHFHTLIQNRRMQRRRDVIDDSFSSDAVEDTTDSSLWEPPEVQEVMDEMGQPTIPLSVISKVAELQLHHGVDKVMLGNRWLRKATGIQPKFPYMVDSFERRTAASFLKDAKSTSAANTLDSDCENNRHELELGSGESKLRESALVEQNPDHAFRFPFGGWFSNPWSRQEQKTYNQITSDTSSKRPNTKEEVQSNPLLPKITMVGISTGETGQVSRSSLKKTMEDLTKKLGETSKSNNNNDKHVEVKEEERDPLFVANVGDYYSGLAKTGSSHWVRARNN